MNNMEKASGLKNQEKPRIIGGAEDAYQKVRKSWDKNKLGLVEKQLEKRITVDVVDRQGRRLKIEGRFINPNPEGAKQKQTLAIIPGWGSDCDGVADFAKHIALNGERPVVTISMPGSGRSDNAPKEWLEEKNFDNEGFVAMQAIRQIKTAGGGSEDEEIAVLGHSMGGMIAAEVARQNPDLVKTLVLAHTAGVEKESEAGLIARFTANAAKESADYLKKWIESGFDEEWGRQVLKHFSVAKDIGKNVFTDRDRLMQHFIKKEVGVLARGGIKEILKEFRGNLITVSGTDEHLFSPDQTDDLKSAAVNALSSEAIISNLSKHSDVIARADQEAILVAHKLDRL